MFDSSVCPDFDDVEARVGFPSPFHPIELRYAFIATAFCRDYRLCGSPVFVRSPSLYLCENDFVAVLRNQIRFSERSSIILM